MSDLSIERLKYSSSDNIPKVLNSDYRVVKQYTLNYPTGEVKLACEKNYPFICKESGQLVEVLSSTSVMEDHTVMPRR